MSGFLNEAERGSEKQSLEQKPGDNKDKVSLEKVSNGFKPIGDSKSTVRSSKSSGRNSPRSSSRSAYHSLSPGDRRKNNPPLRRVGSKLGLANPEKTRTVGGGDSRPTIRRQRSRKKSGASSQGADTGIDGVNKDAGSTAESTVRDRSARSNRKVDRYSNNKFIKTQLEEFNHMQLAITTTSRVYKILGKINVRKLYKKWVEKNKFSSILSVATIDDFAVFFGQMCDETKSRHGEMLRNDRRLSERLFYLFDKEQNGYVDLREVIATVVSLASGTLEDKLRFCFRAMDNKGNGHLTVSELVNLVRAFINHGSNLSIAEALGQIEQFGSDVVTVRKYLNMDVVNDIKKAIGSTGASLVVTQQERRNIMVKYGIFTDAKIESRVRSWMNVGGDEHKKHIDLETFLQLVDLKRGVIFDSKLDHKTKDLSNFMLDYARICNPYAEFDDQDSDDEDERDEEGEDLNHQKKDIATGKGEEHMGQDGSGQDTSDDPLQKSGVYDRKRITNTRKIKSPKLTEEKKAMKVKRQNEEKEEMEEAKEATRKIRLGICAMDKKSRSRPMQEIMRRLPEKEFEIVVFGNRCLLEEPVEEWPIVDCLIGFYSKGFPLKKAEDYVKLRQPWCCNNLESEYVLRDRRRVYTHLEKNHIAVPPHVFCSRDGYEGAEMPVVIEKEDYIVVNGKKIKKPFVEKPVDGEDHNIYVYYSSKTGGGSKRLFRKVNDRSSKFYADVNNIRTEGSYIYESFLSTGGTDIKVYTCGPSYVHAEARKAPTLDGIVQRDKNGKEVRFPIVLRPFEKLMARKVVLSFGMRFCGFDILKCRNKSYVCDVNGFSFVKTSVKYYEDAASILREMLTRYMGRHLDRRVSMTELTPLPGFECKDLEEMQEGESTTGSNIQVATNDSAVAVPMSNNLETVNSDNQILKAGKNDIDADSYLNEDESREKSSSIGNNDPSREELRCVIGIFRHGDRTPKEKLKIKTKNSKWISLHKRFANSPRDELKLKSSIELQTVVKTAESILEELQSSNICKSASAESSDDNGNFGDEDAEDVKGEIESLTNLLRALNRGGSFSGINRKVQIKPLEWKKINLANVAEEFSPVTNALDSPLLYAREISNGAPLSPVRLPASVASANEAGKDLNTKKSCLPIISPTAEDSGGVSSLQVDFSSKLSTLVEEVSKVEVIVKWGGVLTSRGRKQAERLGVWCRNQLYPGEKAGLLRLHSTFRHDLKIYSSDEGRVVTTAAAFAKGFLNLEGPLPPIITSLVRSDEHVTALLDDSSAASTHMKAVKKTLHKNIGSKVPLQDLKNLIAQTKSESVLKALDFLGNLDDALHRLYTSIKSFTSSLEQISKSITRNPRRNKNGSVSVGDTTPIEINIDEWGEEIELIKMRWQKLENDLVKKVNRKDGSIKWDISKIPDIYDCIKYDVLHNHAVVLDIKGVPDLYVLAKALADVVIPQEYGCHHAEKIGIGAKISQRLLRKIIADLAASATLGSEFKHETVYRLDSSYMSELNIRSLSRHVRTRLYFTSESHVHAVLNVLRFGAMVDKLVGQEDESRTGSLKSHSSVPLSEEAQKFLSNTAELNYLTHIVIRLYEIYDDDDDEGMESGGEDDNQRLGRDTDSEDDLGNDDDVVSNRYRVEISFSSGMSPAPIEAKSLSDRDNLEEISLAQNVMHKYRVKVWRDRLDHTLPVEHLVVVQDLTFPEFEDMIQGVLSKVKHSDMGNAWSQTPSDTSDRDIDNKRSRTPTRRSSWNSKNSSSPPAQ